MRQVARTLTRADGQGYGVLIIRESHPSAQQAGTQDAILFHQIPDHVLLTSAEPARERREDLKRGNGRWLSRAEFLI